MNLRNVEALAALKDGIPRYSSGDLVFIANIIADCRKGKVETPEEAARLLLPHALDLMAEYLASRGVLVPSALTDEEMEVMWEAATLEDFDMDDNHHYSFAFPDRARETLERVAKGEAA